MWKKQKILDLKNVYTAHAFKTSGEWMVGAGSETEPDVRLYHLKSGEGKRVDGCPGGMMAFLPIPGDEQAYVSIMGLFPPFIGLEAGLYLHREKNPGWITRKAMDLPFAHRCEFHPSAGGRVLVAASVSRHKDDPPDWSRPGEVHIIPLDDPDEMPWRSRVMDVPVTRNHGMTLARIGGTRTVCISGAEGIFAIQPGEDGSWKAEPILEREVSEMTFIDLDGDGMDELVTIEPFHGDKLHIYKRIHERWERKYTDSLSFGHGLSGGRIKGRPVVAAGNRSGSLTLDLFTPVDLENGIVNRIVLEDGAGPTQTQVFSADGEDYILSANQKKNEVALYRSE